MPKIVDMAPKKKPLRVVHVSDNEMDVVLNGGRNQGIKNGDSYVIYHLSDEPLVDPETEEELERLKTIRGYGYVVQVQEKICTVRSSKNARLSRIHPVLGISSALSALYPERVYDDEVTAERPFRYPEIGDYATPH